MLTPPLRRPVREQVASVVSTIKSHPNDPLTLLVQRGGEKFTVPVTPVPGRDGRGAIGISLYSNSYIKHTKANSIGRV